MIVFISNFVSPHTIPLSEYIYESLGNEFLFIETKRMTEERMSLGYSNLQSKPFVVCFDKYDSAKDKYQDIIDNADAVLASFGSIDNSLLSARIRNNRLTFLMSERILKKGVLKLADPKFWKTVLFLNRIKSKNFHLLCMGAYVAHDFGLCGFPKNKMWKFGYITSEPHSPTFTSENIGNRTRILWVGRMIWWKQPFAVITAAELLKERGLDFHIDIVGGGKLSAQFEKRLKNSRAKNLITYHGLKPSHEVQSMMRDADILLCTSNRLEGWGAVINEGMYNRCAVIANKSMGAAPFLIEDGVNGFLYSGGATQLANKIETALKCDRIRLSENALKYIKENWSPEVGAEKLLALIKYINTHNRDGHIPFEIGICSPA